MRKRRPVHQRMKDYVNSWENIRTEEEPDFITYWGYVVVLGVLIWIVGNMAKFLMHLLSLD